MEDILLILQAVTVSFLIILVLLQKSNADGLSGLAGGGHGIFSGRSSANILTKLTFFFAAVFMINSLLLAKINIDNARGNGSSIAKSIIDEQQKLPNGASNTSTNKQVPLVE
jgi:preprotein translocase subunit SecG